MKRLVTAAVAILVWMSAPAMSQTSGMFGPVRDWEAIVPASTERGITLSVPAVDAPFEGGTNYIAQVELGRAEGPSAVVLASLTMAGDAFSAKTKVILGLPQDTDIAGLVWVKVQRYNVAPDCGQYDERRLYCGILVPGKTN